VTSFVLWSLDLLPLNCILVIVRILTSIYGLCYSRVVGLLYKIYCPVCQWLLSPDAWKRLGLRLGDSEDLPLGLMQRSDGKTFYRGANLVEPSDIPSSFRVVRSRLMAAFKVWVLREWISDEDLGDMLGWLKERRRIVRDILLPRRITFIEEKRGQSKYREL